MTSSPTSIMKRLRTYWNNECHYCGLKCNMKEGHPRRATKDHVVPRFFGGKNMFENYVLACADCNSKRGNYLFECDCIFCGPLIAAALDNQECFDHVFKGMYNFNRPRITKVRKGQDKGMWQVNVGTGLKKFSSFQDAVTFAMTEPFHRSYND